MTLSIIARFGGTVDSGGEPVGGLIQSWDGDLYGTTSDGGWNGDYFSSYRGTIFRLTLDGTLETLVSFSGYGGQYPGAYPHAPLTQGRDGNLYGTASEGGLTNGGNGTLFTIIMPGPLLTSVPVGQNIVLSWRTNYVGFTLQSSDALSAPNWIDCTNIPVAGGNYYFVTNSAATAQKFFRLRK